MARRRHDPSQNGTALGTALGQPLLRRVRLIIGIQGVAHYSTPLQGLALRDVAVVGHPSDRRRARGMGEPLMPGTFIGDLACLLSKEGRSASAHAGPGGCEVVVVERSSLLRTSRLDDIVWRGLSLAGEDCWRTQQAKEAKEELIRRAKNRGGD